MTEPAKTAGTLNMHAIILALLGIILLVVGLYIVLVHGAPMRGSGIGTLAALAGFILLFIAFLRFRAKRA